MTRGAEITMEVNEARLRGLLAYLDTGAGNARLLVFADPERPPFGDPSALPTLVTLPLAKPCGEIEEGVLQLRMRDAGGAMILASGLATWARLVTAAGTLAMDLDVSDDAEGALGQVQIPGGTQLYAGGYMTLAPTSGIE